MNDANWSTTGSGSNLTTDHASQKSSNRTALSPTKASCRDVSKQKMNDSRKASVMASRMPHCKGPNVDGRSASVPPTLHSGEAPAVPGVLLSV